MFDDLSSAPDLKRNVPNCNNASSTCKSWQTKSYQRPFYFAQYLFLIWTEVFKAWGSISGVFGRFLSSQPQYHDKSISSSISPLRLIWCVSARPRLLNAVWDWFLKKWQTCIPHSALCTGSCNGNELQSGLFGMLLIFDANIWGKQAFWRTERYDKPCFSCSLCDLTPWWFSADKPISDSLSNFLSISFFTSVSVLTIPRPVFVFLCFHFPLCHPPSLCLSSRLCSTESNCERPSPTGLCRCPALRRWSVSPTSSTFSLPPSVSSPLPSPSLFVTSVDTMTGRDSQTTSQFPPGLGYFTLEF